MTYRFRFAVKNQVGYSEWSAPQEHRMPKIAAPEEPIFIARLVNKVVSSSYHDSYELLWKIPNDNGAHIQRFQITYYPVSFIIYLHLERHLIGVLANEVFAMTVHFNVTLIFYIW